jgi:hypothetical protein
MNLHPRIIEISEAIKALNPSKLLSQITLEYLSSYGATATEAAIALHQVFEIPLEEAGDFIIKSNLFPSESPSDTAYFTMTYMYYDE